VTRAVTVVVEKSPSGGCGWWTKVGPVGRHLFGTPFEALNQVRKTLEEQGAYAGERGRVLDLIIRELKTRRRVEVTAEVAS